MAIVRPFKAVRPAKEYAAEVVSLPYDVMNRKEASVMAEGKPHSFLHICRSEIDLPEEADPYARAVYEKARQNITDWLAQKVLIQDERPMLYIYRQVMDGRVQTGIVGCVSVDEYQNNIIKKHEFTRVEKEIDRINHFDVCNADTEPVFLTYRRNSGVDEIVDAWTKEHAPEYDLQTDDGIAHILWKIDDEDLISSLVACFASIPALYIADGHHRSASAVKVGMKRREVHPDYTGEEEFNFYMAVIFPDEDLKIFDYNRVLKDLNGLTGDQFLEKLTAAGFDVAPAPESPWFPEAKHVFSMFLDEKWYRVAARPEIIPDDIIASLDVAVLQDNVLGPILGIQDPRTDKRIDFVGGIRGLSELERRCREDMKLAFAVYPVDIADLLAVADAGEVMPPKSTWFEPKLGSGLFLHQL
ncbi:DUF1015 domain-containing protein [Bacilliculturomica massiliensis]|uniref:DUF1015 domain-containing protein n=1 Tax=Bacilliculturomica massiliensis TaxID=1917867 RepID=UPI0010308CFD|nr:DUF1015 family protein [Bacilliculturomica massiliensis]